MATANRALLMWCLALGSGAIAAKGPAITTIPAIFMGAASGMVAYQESQKVGGKDWASTLLDCGQCLCTLTPSGATETTVMDARLVESLPAPVADWLVSSTVDPTTTEFWTSKRARASKIYVGARGSGKSVLVGFHCAQMAEAGVDLKISDRHYPESQEWLPGIDRDTFENRYLLKDAEDTYKALMHLQQTLHNRIEGTSQDRSPKHLVIDEWGGLIRKWGDSQIKAAVSAISFIYDEGRKYGIDVSLVVHGLTREKTALDESITGAADLYLMGDSLSQTTYTYPASLSRDRAKLLDARSRLVADVEPAQRVLTYRDALSGEAYPVVAPDLSTPTPLEVPTSVDDWLMGHDPTITAMVSDGASLRAVCEALGVKRSNKNPQYVALKNYLQELNETHV